MKYDKVKEGEIAAYTFFVKIQGKNRGTIKCDDLERGSDFEVRGKPLVESGVSADQFDKIEKVSRTKMVELLEKSWGKPFTVCFEKKDGTERVLRGYLVNPETGMGRSQVVDLDIERKEGEYDNRLRQTDHRSLSFLILDGTKYVVKK